MNLTRKFLFISAWCLLMLSHQRSIANENTLMEGYYANIDKLNCGNHNILITSSCKIDAEKFEYCHTQTIAFIKINGSLEKSYLYSYKSNPQPFIRYATCLKYNKKYFLNLESANLGNCKICEWSDYFSSDGFYIYSNKGMRNDVSFKLKIIPRKKFEKLGIPINSTEISIMKK